MQVTSLAFCSEPASKSCRKCSTRRHSRHTYITSFWCVIRCRMGVAFLSCHFVFVKSERTSFHRSAFHTVNVDDRSVSVLLCLQWATKHGHGNFKACQIKPLKMLQCFAVLATAEQSHICGGGPGLDQAVQAYRDTNSFTSHLRQTYYLL